MDPYIDFFRRYSEYMTELGGFLNLSSSIKTLFRAIGWGVIKLLWRLCASVETVFYEMFDLMDILKASTVLDFLDRTGHFALALLAIPIVFMGYRLMTGDDFSPRKALKNVLYSIVILITVTGVVSMLSDLTQIGIREFNGQGGQMSSYRLTMADEMITGNVIDLAYKYENSSSSDKKNGVITGGIFNDPNSLSAYDIQYIDINDLICYSLTEKDHPFLYHYYVDPDGVMRREDFADNSTGIKWLDDLVEKVPNQKTSYARYYVDFFNLLLCLMALAIAYVCAVYKICRIIFELIVSELMLQFAAVLDMAGLERTKKVVANIVNSFLALFGMAVMFRLYCIIYTYLMQWSFLESHRFVRTITVIAFSFGILSGPDIIKSILGVDIGFSSFASTMQSLFYTGQVVHGTGAALASMAGSAAGFAAGTAGRFAGSVAGKVSARRFAEDNDLKGGAQGQSRDHPTGNDPGGILSRSETSSSSFDSRSFAEATEDTSSNESASFREDDASTVPYGFPGVTDESYGETAAADPAYAADAAVLSTVTETGTETQENVSGSFMGQHSGDISEGPVMRETHPEPQAPPGAADTLSRYPNNTAAETVRRNRDADNARLAQEIVNSVHRPGDLKRILEETDSKTHIRSFDEGFRKGYTNTARRTLKKILKRNRKV